MELNDFLRDCIVSAHKSTIETYIGDVRNKVQAFLLNSACGLNLYLIPSAIGLRTTVDSVFSAAVNRDYILNTTIRFQTLFNSGNFDQDAMIDILCHSMTVSEEEQTQSLIPKEINDRLPSQREVEDALKRNKWLVTFVLLIIFYKDILESMEKK